MLYKTLDGLIAKYKKIFIVGDFNLSRAQLSELTSSGTDILIRLAHEHGLRQLAFSPSRRDALLDLILVYYADCEVINLLPVVALGHNAQILRLRAKDLPPRTNSQRDYQHLRNSLGGVN